MLNLPLEKLQPIIKILSRYGVMIIIIAIGAVYGFLIYRSGELAKNEPSASEISEKYQGANRPKIDKAVTDKLNDLRDSNVQFNALIDRARDNPFQE